MPHSFKNNMRSDFTSYLNECRLKSNASNSLKMDLHCHDFNSDVPDELWGRILRLPETWIKSEELLACLQTNGATAFTITNHNNARSCWSMLNKGYDILSAAEFTCTFPEYELYIHVLCYGFTPAQEVELNKRRKNVYAFVEYVAEQDLVTVLPHPLYFYKRDGIPPMEIFEKFALLFTRFEVLNGQRDIWQNLLTKEWISSLTNNDIDSFAKKHGLNPQNYSKNPYRKMMTAGSDDHMGIFAGRVGTNFIIDDLQAKLKTQTKANLILDCFKNGEYYPYGELAEEEKLTIAFLDYFCQVGIKMKDPGLVRMMLHRGTLKDKMICLAISNGMQELRRHKYTYRFLNVFHDALHGKAPGYIDKWSVSKDFRPILSRIEKIAETKKLNPDSFLNELKGFVPSVFNELNQIIAKRIDQKIRPVFESSNFSKQNMDEMISKFEITSHFRTLMGLDKDEENEHFQDINIAAIFDHLTFPSLISIILASAQFTGTRVLYNGRNLLNQFARKLGKYEHPHRILWLTDTLFDKNGVSSVLQHTVDYVREENLPIDFLVVSNEIKASDHLFVVPSLAEFSLAQFSDQTFRFPNLLEIHQIFMNNSYDRIICSTEILMGLISLYLKEAFRVPAYFYMHTDWLEYAEKNTQLDMHQLDRVRRSIRALYSSFDGVFVLNSDHQKWLTSSAIGLKSDAVFKTAHWLPEQKEIVAEEIDLSSLDPDKKTLLFAGRISKEKGIFELPTIYNKVKEMYPKVQFVFAGKGVNEDELKALMPDAIFLGWVKASQLNKVYQSADLLVLPSRFDTFAMVVLESMSKKVPAVAYNCKGPKDIISNGINGFLAEDENEMAHKIVEFFNASETEQNIIKEAALKRAQDYQAKRIMTEMLDDIKLDGVTLLNIAHPEVDEALQVTDDV